MRFKVAVIGGGPAGLMAAEQLSDAGAQVTVFDTKRTPGRKFLLAGKGGLNLTHSEDWGRFMTRYRDRADELKTALNQFNNQNLRDWVAEFGIETFIGSSGRVFPRDLKAAPLLRAWLLRLKSKGVLFSMQHHWTGWSEKQTLQFETPEGDVFFDADAVILALGGGSWAKLGSDGGWVPVLSEQGVSVAPLQPSNCGFNVSWSEHLSCKFAGQPLKSVVLTLASEAGRSPGFSRLGECLISENGLQGSLIYAASSWLRERVVSEGYAIISLDLLPEHSLASIEKRLQKNRGNRSLTSHLQRQLKLSGAKVSLVYELLKPEQRSDTKALAYGLKNLQIRLTGLAPIDEAISTAGGVSFEGLDQNYMLNKKQGVFCAGEMLDWDAPTGGYLLTACFATGRSAAQGALKWWDDQQSS